MYTVQYSTWLKWLGDTDTDTVRVHVTIIYVTLVVAFQILYPPLYEYVLKVFGTVQE